MEVDFSIELGSEDPTLDIPWSDAGGAFQYHNLKLEPAALNRIAESAQAPELREFLAEVNSRESALESAKCDVWSTTQLEQEEEVFGEPWKFASYVDLLFSDPALRSSFPLHEQLLKALIAPISAAPETAASVELILRRCFYQRGEALQEGFYFTAYVFGYGVDEAQARRRWAAALQIVRCALRKLPAPPA